MKMSLHVWADCLARCVALASRRGFQLSPQVSEGHLELQLFFSQRLHLLDEVLEGRLELVPHLPLHLLRVEVVSVVHVLVFAQVCGDLPDLCVELDVCVAPLTEHDGVLVRGKRQWSLNDTVLEEWTIFSQNVGLVP